jgi:K+-sensing histidine kinase KdpD
LIVEPSTLASRHWRLAVAAVAGLGVALFTLLMSPHSPGAVGTTTPAIVYLLLVLLASLVGGRAAGLSTAVVALIAQVYYFVPPNHGFGIENSRNAVSVTVFALAELTVTLVGASQRDARLSALRAGGRAARLQRFTSSLSRALTAQAVYDVALTEGRELLGADAGMVALPIEDRTAVEMVATFGFSDEETAAWRRFPISQRTPIGEAIESGRAVFLDEGQRESLFPASGGGGAPTASVPLRVDDHTLGALGFRFERGHIFDDDEREFAVVMGEQCAYALERARVYDAERRSRGALGLLATVGEQLARSLEPNLALRTLADLVVPSLADQCIVDIVEGDEVRRLVVVNANPEVHEAALVLERFPPVLSSETPV